MKRLSRSTSLIATAVVGGVIALGLTIPAMATTHPGITGMSTHRGDYWGGTTVTVHGYEFTNVRKVVFGGTQAWNVQVISPTELKVVSPWHGYGKIQVRVVTASGESAKNSASGFTFAPPTMSSHIQGGLTGKQEQSISAKVRAHHHGVQAAPHARSWTTAMGVTALKRARSWLGLPYSWAGGNGSGPTTGVCAHNGGDLDCHIVGFDCSGLTEYAWYPYKHMAHYAASQKGQAGRFHPSIDQLMPGDLVFFSAYIPNGIGHVAIYEGNGNVIQAEESGTTVMRSKLADVIRFSGSYRGATRPMSTGRQGAVPRLSSVTSQVSVKGGSITVVGSNLRSATAVWIGGKTLYSFARSDNKLVVKVPAHAAGKVTVAVSNAWGTAKRTVSYVGAPTIRTMSVHHGTTLGGNNVNITGANLATVSKVTAGASTVRFAVVNDVMTLTMPVHRSGTVHVILHSRFGDSNAVAYLYVAPVTPAPTTEPAPSSSAPSPPKNAKPGSPAGSGSGSATNPVSPSTSSSSPSSSPGNASPTGAPSSGAPSSSAASSSAAPSGAAPSASSTG